ncbi:similar to hypothetical protein KAFR_0E01900 [Kazachstania africana CBS 2517] [Maudiozyma barnettii]|uniref:Peroxisomal membrane protein PEX14-like KPWE domain-containing protein n=1 Tax=Maudiozyma barnettii TaxID=61262 RepID=A0A8H2VG73_9SACH|nr:similar to hypothetical protein KAFR_0E01900 [Kazachstania africana CBS 2517] [Kazachstania barnettii]CAB4254907.1 similar to hypothetical protein KAFR_0E01900 [Kazachstania africana CBS 2517] [Kazachstania barnettii]CAD1783175.1 similar to hypothetical protein KAFR_0E01900 [Kazachstania africana CBS 2517] [Kazachstania barnettii]
MSTELTYDEIVEHIVQNKEIPNSVQVPNIILDDSQRSESTMSPRYKPWERRHNGDMTGNSAVDTTTSKPSN